MSIFAEIERLINERGSSTILKDRIFLLKEKHAVFVGQNITHRTKISELGTQVRQLENEITKLQQINEKLNFENSQLNDQIESFHASDPKDYVCDYCSSNRLRKTGNKPNERFGKIGIKDAIFLCEDCGKETVVMIIPPK